MRAALIGVGVWGLWASVAVADSRAPDWVCTHTPHAAPRIVPAGEISVLDNLPGDMGSTYKLNMVRIKPGRFILGSAASEHQRERYEGPAQKVAIAYAFEVGKYEVTFDDWETCLAGGGCNGYRPDDSGWGRGDRPVINVSWQDAQNYIAWLNTATGLTYRLLSEAEWEYVARAGTDTPFYTGKNITSHQANFNGQHPYTSQKKGPYRRQTLPVGSFKPNRFGLYDILGNAFEWTQDCWHESHEGNPGDGRAREDGDCKFRLMKGGSWVNHGYQIRVAKRTRYTPDYRYDDYGFRIARTLP